jgi:hypothetical protein
MIMTMVVVTKASNVARVSKTTVSHGMSSEPDLGCVNDLFPPQGESTKEAG